MVSFRHGEGGTPERHWESAHWWASLPALSLGGMTRLVVLAAHPDDETLGAGGLISRAAALGVPITVVIASNGEASHPLSPTHTPRQLAAIRRDEVLAAVTGLAPTATVRFLDFPDGAVSEHIPAISQAISAEIAHGGVGTRVFAPWRADGHPDHAAVGDAAAAAIDNTAARLWEYPIWAWHWSEPTSDLWREPRLRILELPEADHAAKARAIAAHTSQVEPLSAEAGDEAVVSPSFAAHFLRSFETFVETTPTPATETESLTVAFFDDFYDGDADPWGFESRWYEKRKRALTLAALPRARFSSALELGCSIGVLTLGLAARCDALLATDIAERPLEIARQRLADHPGVSFEKRALPGEWPDGGFDLIVLSEMGYYCSAADLAILLERCRTALNPDGVLVACHWRHPVASYPLSGDAVHHALAETAGLERTIQHVERDFLLDVYEAAPARSVAQRENLVDE